MKISKKIDKKVSLGGDKWGPLDCLVNAFQGAFSIFWPSPAHIPR